MASRSIRPAPSPGANDPDHQSSTACGLASAGTPARLADDAGRRTVFTYALGGGFSISVLPMASPSPNT